VSRPRADRPGDRPGATPAEAGDAVEPGERRPAAAGPAHPEAVGPGERPGQAGGRVALGRESDSAIRTGESGLGQSDRAEAERGREAGSLQDAEEELEPDEFVVAEPADGVGGACAAEAGAGRWLPDAEGAGRGNAGPAGENGPRTERVTVEARAHGWRLDHYLARLHPNFSRAQFQREIETGEIVVNGLPAKAARRLHVNDIVQFHLPRDPDRTVIPEDLPLEVLFEDAHLVVLNKSANMVVHPGRGHQRGTLVGALQFHFDRLSDVAGADRPGIVHRLDRDTTGVIVVAKDNQVHARLAEQFEQREVQKQYVALAWGVFDRDSDWVETHLRVNPREREKMMVCEPGDNTRVATTYYEVMERFYDFTWVRLHPRTGRTHQLRVHLQHLGHPIVADRLYGGRPDLRLSQLGSRRDSLPAVPRRSPARLSPPDVSDPGEGPADGDEGAHAGTAPADPDVLICRQALHAQRLSFRHPVSQAPLTFEAPLPDDMARTLAALRATR